MSKVKLYTGGSIPIEMHRVSTVRSIKLISPGERLRALQRAGNCSYNLRSEDVFIDMLTDSGFNAMSCIQAGAMHGADYAYAGGEGYYRMRDKLYELFGKEYFLPVHQGRAAEHMLARAFVREGNVIPLNFHFGTFRTQVMLRGATVAEFLADKGRRTDGSDPFKGDFDLVALESFLSSTPKERIPFLRIEAGTNLIGGQPVSADNMLGAMSLCRKYCIRSVIDLSLYMDNLYFLKTRDESCRSLSLRDITRRLCEEADIIYFSGRKLGFARGGGICTNDRGAYELLRSLISCYEGFPTFGGMSSAELEVMRVGMDDMMDEDVISQGPDFIEYMTEEFLRRGVPVVTPAGGLGCHLDADRFCAHLPKKGFRGAALASALYLISGVRGMERGASSEPEGGTVSVAPMELLRLAVPRRVYTLSHLSYVIDRVAWLHEHRGLIGALRWKDEDKACHCFTDHLDAVDGWQDRLLTAYINEGLEST